MAETFIKVENLSYLYDADDGNEHKALRNVSFEINIHPSPNIRIGKRRCPLISII